MVFKSEFDELLSNVYEEDEYEMNERANVKKIILLFVTLSLYQSFEGFSEVLNCLDLWEKKKLELPKTNT